MVIAAGSLCHERGSQPALTVGEIFRTYGPQYAAQHSLTPQQAKVMRAIERCRTAALGGHAHVCQACGHTTPMYNSCRDRHCPVCQSLDQATWIRERLERVLPVRHFHVVFTLPQELRSLVMGNPRQLYDLLLRCAGETLVELGRDPKRLGADIGVTTILHTWTRELLYHPHAHCVVTAGGLATDGSPRWIHTQPNFLFSVRVMSQLFRGKFLAGLRKLADAGDLRIDDRPAFNALLKDLYKTGWLTYAKEPFAGTEHVFKYLGRYTHRVGISDQRLQAVNDSGITFYTKNGNSCTLSPDEFMRRFLLHVLPSGFRKIRHYGLYGASNVKTKLEQARKLLPQPATTTPVEEAPATWQELLQELTDIDLGKCPACGSSDVQWVTFPRPDTS